MDTIGKQTSKTNSRETNLIEQHSLLFNTDPIASFKYKVTEEQNNNSYNSKPEKLHKLLFWQLVYEELIIGLMLAILILTF